MRLHNFDANGFYLGSVDADENPLEPGEYLIPANATVSVPPDVGDKQALRFIEAQWQIVPDLRGTEYWLDGKKHTVSEAGVDLPDSAVTEKPASVIAAELEEERGKSVAAVNSVYAETMRLLTGGATAEECDTWPIQLQIAQAIVGGAAVSEEDDALVSGILKPSETREQWAAKVVYKNRKIKELIGTANGLLRTTLDKIAAAQSVEELDAVKAEAAAKADAAKQAFLQG